MLNFDLTALDFGSLQKVYVTFGEPWFLLAGWMHYLAFDLWIGAWIVKDSHQRGIYHPLLIPILALTFYLGPIGFLIYQCVLLYRDRTQRSGASHSRARKGF